MISLLFSLLLLQVMNCLEADKCKVSLAICVENSLSIENHASLMKFIPEYVKRVSELSDFNTSIYIYGHTLSKGYDQVSEALNRLSDSPNTGRSTASDCIDKVIKTKSVTAKNLLLIAGTTKHIQDKASRKGVELLESGFLTQIYGCKHFMIV